MVDRDGQDDEDFPLADHPPYKGPKAGDREMNRARDLQHLDVAGSTSRVVFHTYEQAELEVGTVAPIAPTPSSNPVVAAWQGFKQTTGYTGALNSADPSWAMFMAGYAARDAQ